MSKPRASLTLRKPASASSADIEAFISGAAIDVAPTPPVAASQSSHVAPEAAPTPAPISPLKSVPATPGTSATVEKGTVVEDDVVVFRRPHKSNIARKKGMRRRTTVYFDLALAKELGHYCIDRDMEMSDVVNAAVEAFLASNS